MSVIKRSRRSIGLSLPPMCLDIDACHWQLQAGFVQYQLHSCRKSCYILQPTCPPPGYHICSARSTAFQIERNDPPAEHRYPYPYHMCICSSTSNSGRKSVFTATVTQQQITLPTAYGGVTAAIWTLDRAVSHRPGQSDLGTTAQCWRQTKFTLVVYEVHYY